MWKNYNDRLYTLLKNEKQLRMSVEDRQKSSILRVKNYFKNTPGAMYYIEICT